MDDEQQKNPLEYRPSFERDARERTAWDLPAADAPASPHPLPPPASTIGGGLATEGVKHLKDLGDRLNNLRESLYEELKTEPLILPDKFHKDTEAAKAELGLTGEGFTFAHYAEALKQWHTPAGDFLTEVAERYIEGVDGNLDMELFQDYQELQTEHHILVDYLSRALEPILAGDTLDLSDPDWDEKLRRQELDWGLRHQTALEEKAKRDEAYKTAFLTNQSDLSRQRALRYQEEEKQKTLTSEASRMHDGLLILQNKLREMERFLHTGETLRESGWEPNEQTAILQSLAGVTEDQNRNDRLTQSALMLTLAVENRNSEKHHIKHTLRNTYAPEKQRRVLDEMSLYQSLYDRDVLPLLHTLRAYSEEPPAAVANFLGSITSAMGDVAANKEKRTLDWQNLQSATSALRLQKVREVAEKEQARKGYQLLRALQEEPDA